MFKYNKLSNKNKANNILIKVLNKFYNKFKKYNLNIIVSILVKIIKLSFKNLK